MAKCREDRVARALLRVVLTGAGLLAAVGCSPTDVPPPGKELEQDVQLVTETGTIHGTLLLPDVPPPHPVVLIIAGSGPTDRNGNSAVLPGSNNSLKYLAEGLAEEGIASVRYDKRGVAQSASAALSEIDLRFETYIDDARGWLHQLQTDSDFSGVSLLGHSEGSLIGMIAAAPEEASSFISVSGLAKRASDVLREQLSAVLSGELWEESERILSELEAGRTVDSVSLELYPLFRPSVQPYLISWFRYLPTEEIARLQMPVLIAQGTTDMQVSIEEAGELHAAKQESQLLFVEGMNHVLKLVPADPAAQEASYSDPTLPVAPALVEGVSAFIN